MANPIREIRKRLNDADKYLNVQIAEVLLKQIRRKYRGRVLFRRIGYKMVPTSGTAFFERHYGDLWEKMRKLKKGMQ